MKENRVLLNRTERINIRLTKETADILSRLAYDQRKSKTDVIEDLLLVHKGYVASS